MLASDLNNREFVGASNPDDHLSVQFYVRPVQNENKSLLEGRPIFEDVTFVKIFSPGDTLNIIDCPMRDEHKGRFPRQWAVFQNAHGEDTRHIGTPIAQWPRISASQAEELRAIKFFTVEQIAGASDAAIERMGMLAGMSPYAFRDLAKNYLSVAKGEADVSKRDIELQKLRDEQKVKDEQHAVALKALSDQVAALTRAVQRGKPGRKAAEQVA